ncbi:hypothetical protein [Blastococcus xanthinilyticus]|uniref:Uncharacterized protein n=1 Tax=Blastococcus xanthinilyticus TaxID=1564164 RepID=A0A5S5CNZ2_9ACTN|nr:hypothetical protein [Blastococcus xanthinilyticus]TYP82035.1 hypothetical protein BD833_12019 [Blastococcus xanthinilyticus]
MSRDIRRVPVDFDWPLNKVWDGFLLPDELRLPPCPACEGMGWSPEAKLLQNRWYGKAPFRPEDRGSEPLTVETPGVRAFAERNVAHATWFYGEGEAAIVREAHRLSSMWNQQWCHHLNQADVDALVAAGRLMDFTHTWSREDGWQPKDPPHVPTAAEVNAWSLSGLGHDSINQSVVVHAELERQGLSDLCPNCNGAGEVGTDEQRATYEAWEPTAPPTGEGWQLWESVSEGSPISPVFGDREALIGWLTTDYSWGAQRTPLTREQAEAFVGLGHSIGSGVIASDGRHFSGEAAVAELRGGTP